MIVTLRQSSRVIRQNRRLISIRIETTLFDISRWLRARNGKKSLFLFLSSCPLHSFGSCRRSIFTCSQSVSRDVWPARAKQSESINRSHEWANHYRLTLEPEGGRRSSETSNVSKFDRDYELRFERGRSRVEFDRSSFSLPRSTNGALSSPLSVHESGYVEST